MIIIKREEASYTTIIIRILILFNLFILFGGVITYASSIQINELMINPFEPDSSYEWIELYNSGNTSVNLSGWKLTDNYATDELFPANTSIPLLIPPDYFVLITDQDTDLSIPIDENDSVVHFMVDDNSICNGLGNTNDYLLLVNENETIIDSIEWGINSPIVPGEPILTPNEGNSIIRTNTDQSNSSIFDFVETTIPTPGQTNTFSKTGSIHISTVQQYIPKVINHAQYSIPFAIQIKLLNFTPLHSYQLKTFITEKMSNQYPASQTWTGEKWQYSDRYTHTINTTENGSWHGWLYLRFSKNYKAYNDHIKHNTSCQINLKIKDNNTIEETSTTAFLLDIDNSTTHGIPGGYIIGSTIKNQRLFLYNESQQLISCYKSEPNAIDEYDSTINGFYMLTGPVGLNYTLYSRNETGDLICQKDNMSIIHGYHYFDIETIKSSFDRENRKEFSTILTINNTGSLPDSYHLSITDQSPGFHAHLETTTVSLQTNEKQQIQVYINPISLRLFKLRYGSITVEIISEKNPLLRKTHVFSCQLHEPDILIPKIKSYDMNGEETNTCYEGQIFRIKAFLKNQGDEKARDVTVSYFLDNIDPAHLLGEKTYESVEQYQKYPSLYWDTHLVSPGDHTIYVVADYLDTIKELDESNNEHSIKITIQNSTPSIEEQQLIITEFYYYAHPTIHNEFIIIHNPSNTAVHLDDWYLTNTINQRISDQKKILFKEDTILDSNSSFIITQNASAYQQQQMKNADFEYETNSNNSIPQLNTTCTIYLSNNNGAIALKDAFNHTIDLLIYGNTTINHTFWNNSPIPGVAQGEILKRNKENNTFIDTNSASDWIQPVTYCIGRSIFSPELFFVNATITPFISPDTSFSVIQNYIENTQSEILLNVYEFTSTDIANMLIDALHRNITVKILIEGSPIGGMSEKQHYLLNKLQNHGAMIQLLQGDQINHIFKRYRFTHAKYAVLDQETIIIHSGNFAPTGIPIVPTFGNREWGIVITNKTIAHFYENVFLNDWNPDRKDTITYSYDFKNKDYFFPEDSFYGLYQPILNQSPKFQDTISIQPVLSPDNSLSSIRSLLSQANQSIYIQQLYIYPNWSSSENPLFPLLIEKADQGLDVRIILNYNPWYDSTNIKNNKTKTLLESHDIKVKYIYTNWSIFQNVHNKGMIIDNQSVLISSINWNENSFLNNREIGIIIDHSTIAQLYSTVFLSDWYLTDPWIKNETTTDKTNASQFIKLNTNTIYIIALFTMTFIVIARDWRKRSWH